MENDKGGNVFEKIAIIIVLNLALYFKTLRFKFVSDDFSVWKNPPKTKNQWHMRWLQFMGQLKRQSTAFIPVWDKGRLHMGRIPSEEQEHLLALLIQLRFNFSRHSYRLKQLRSDYREVGLLRAGYIYIKHEVYIYIALYDITQR